MNKFVTCSLSIFIVIINHNYSFNLLDIVILGIFNTTKINLSYTK